MVDVHDCALQPVLEPIAPVLRPPVIFPTATQQTNFSNHTSRKRGRICAELLPDFPFFCREYPFLPGLIHEFYCGEHNCFGQHILPECTERVHTSNTIATAKGSTRGHFLGSDETNITTAPISWPHDRSGMCLQHRAT